jgi:hypothetical protein
VRPLPTGYLALLLRHRNFSLLWLSGLLAYFARSSSSWATAAPESSTWRAAWGSVLSGFGVGAVAIVLGLGFLGEGLLKPITMALLQQQTDPEYLARVLSAEHGLSAVTQSAVAAIIAGCVTEIPSSVLWVSAATGAVLIAMASCIKLRRAPADVQNVGDETDLDLETAAAQVFLPE